MIHDIIMSFTLMTGLVFGYLFFTWWLNWFSKNYEIRRKKIMKNKKIEELLDKLKDKDWYDKLDLTETRWIKLRQEETNLLLSYIEQLENNRDKAVREIINMIENGNIEFFKGKKLENILKGDSDDK